MILLLLGLAASAPATPATPPLPVTFTRDIAPVVFSQCMTCHRPGEVGPFPLTTYAEVRRKSKTILNVIDDNLMPPWRAQSHGQFLGERKLTAGQKAAFHAWVEAGAPEGDPSELPPAPHFTAGWQLGTPDLVLEPDAAYPLAADGRNLYRCFVLPTHNPEDRYVSAVEVRPGNRAVVHHALLYLDTTGRARELAAAEASAAAAAAGPGAVPAPGYTSFGGVGFLPQGGLGGWAPGIVPRALPAGVGYFLPKNADIVLQVHYHRDGKPESDRTRIGLFFSKGPIDKRYRSFPLAYRALHIPAGDANYTVQTSWPLPRNVTLLSIAPHMHLLGREMTVTASLPGGTSAELIHIPDWDFNWQASYWLVEPLKLPRGTRLTLSARYDNSADNPRNPNRPPRDVVRGEQTTNEMCIAFVGYTLDSEHLNGAVAAR